MVDKALSVVELSEIEKEIVVLKAIKELVDSIVNPEVLTLSDKDPVEVRFHSTTHAKFFNLVLVDLLSKIDEKGFVEPDTYLSCLAAITENPHFNVDGSVGDLAASTQQFRAWLDTRFVMEEVWLPSIETKMNLELSRIELVKIGGNICRHNFLRAVGISMDVRKMLRQNGVNITLDQALLILSELNEWLYNNVFYYHSSTIAEFLNNIRLGIYTYLQPELSRSIVMEAGVPPIYRYAYPDGVVTAFGKDCYWTLMNEVRTKPYMRRFEVTELLKKRY
ncbi:MAG TPA: hypothetical protein DD670_14950 [Planctomycetaceae bacterium]|nr:hypothetical protein [Planctomycetaceae bacterium]